MDKVIISLGLAVFATLWALAWFAPELYLRLTQRRPWLRPPDVWRLSRQQEVLFARAATSVLFLVMWVLFVAALMS